MRTNQLKWNIISTYILFFISTLFVFQNCSKLQETNLDGTINSKIITQPTSQRVIVPVSGNEYSQISTVNAQDLTSPDQVSFKEYLHIPSGRFFYTSRVNDQQLIEAPSYSTVFKYTGKTISIKASLAVNYRPLTRLYNSDGFHYYTSDENKMRNLLTQNVWRDEGTEGFVINNNSNANCPSSPNLTYPIRSLYHPNLKYRLVFESSVREQMLLQGYVDQGVVFCANFVKSDIQNQEPPSLSCKSNQTVDINQPIQCQGQSFSSLSHYLSQNPTQSCISINGFNVKDGFGPCLSCNQNLNSNINTNTCSNCSLNGSLILHGNSVTTYSSALVPAGISCSSISQQRYCNNGVLSGSFQHTSCSVNSVTGSNSCSFGSSIIAHGSSVTAFQSSTSANCSLISQTRQCQNGVLSGSYSFASCSQSVQPAVCTSQTSATNFILDGNTNYNTSAINAKMQGSQIYVIEIIPGDLTARNILTWDIRSGNAAREISISPCRGDFTSSEAKIISRGLIQENQGASGKLSWIFDQPNKKPVDLWPQVNLQSGRKYYINFKNTSCEGSTYGVDTCMMYWFAYKE